MAEETETREREAPARTGGGTGLTKKWHGVPLWGWTLGGTVAAVVAWKWWKGRKGGASATSTSTATTTQTGPCYDSAGNPVPCTASPYGELVTALSDLYGQGSTAGTGTKTSTTTSTTTGTGTGTKPTVPGVHVIRRGRDYLNVGWTAVPGIKVYQLHAYQGDKLVRSASTPTTHYKITGLKKGVKYHIYVRANGGPAGHGIYGTTLR